MNSPSCKLCACHFVAWLYVSTPMRKKKIAWLQDMGMSLRCLTFSKYPQEKSRIHQVASQVHVTSLSVFGYNPQGNARIHQFARHMPFRRLLCSDYYQDITWICQAASHGHVTLWYVLKWVVPWERTNSPGYETLVCYFAAWLLVNTPMINHEFARLQDICHFDACFVVISTRT